MTMDLSKNIAQARQIIRQLERKKSTLAVAESCTGGLLSALLTQIEGASQVYLGGVCCYTQFSKIKILGVPEQCILDYGVVSTEVARNMAESVRVLHGADYGVGITGYAGPTGGSKTYPLGSVCVGFSSKEATRHLSLRFEGERGFVIHSAVDATLDFLTQFIDD